MFEIFGMLGKIFKILFAALVAYYETDEGRKEIDDLLAEVEADGIDVPIWTPEQGFGVFGDMLGAIMTQQNAAEQTASHFSNPPIDPAKAWQAKKAAAVQGGE